MRHYHHHFRPNGAVFTAAVDLFLKKTVSRCPKVGPLLGSYSHVSLYDKADSLGHAVSVNLYRPHWPNRCDVFCILTAPVYFAAAPGLD